MVEAIGLLAAACILSASIPQIVAVLRHGAHGVSVASWSLLLATNLVWTAVGLAIGSLSTVVGNIAGVVAFSILVAVLLYADTRAWWAAALVIPAGAAVFLLARALPLPATEAAGIVLGVSLALPQLRLSWRSWRHGEESDVALGAWALILLGQVLWLLYGVLAGQFAIVLVNAVAGGVSVAILAIELRLRRRERHSRGVGNAAQSPQPG